MSYINEKEKMKKEAEAHKRTVFTAITITFVVFALLVFLLCASLVVNLISNVVKNGWDALDLNSIGQAKDEEAPSIIGPSNGVYIGYVGETPMYKQMVQVVDNIDENPTLTVNNSEVNKDVIGDYKVYYKAVDAEGNVSKYTLIYRVMSQEFSKTTLMAMIADEAESYGITELPTKTQKVRKIYEYVQSKIVWESGASGIGESNIPNIDRANWETDWVEEAVRTLESGCGDCYSYYSLSKAFFEYFDIENEGIQRSPLSEEVGTHFWNVVKVEEGWYYYDGTRLAGKFSDGTRNACLITQAKLDSYVTSKGGTEFYLMSKKVTKVSKTPLN